MSEAQDNVEKETPTLDTIWRLTGIIEKGLDNVWTNHLMALPYITGNDYDRSPHNAPLSSDGTQVKIPQIVERLNLVVEKINQMDILLNNEIHAIIPSFYKRDEDKVKSDV